MAEQEARGQSQLGGTLAVHALVIMLPKWLFPGPRLQTHALMSSHLPSQFVVSKSSGQISQWHNCEGGGQAAYNT